MAQATTTQDFAPLPQYRQTKNRNASWLTVVTTKTESDGSTTQHLQIIKR
ncbi:MAG: hypothetical protein F6J86_37265 [Symploca sp. SIO1B1]|nr:hypothetical protein [Symploca sp. SIO1B1]